jgi:hypothetical protein
MRAPDHYNPGHDDYELHPAADPPALTVWVAVDEPGDDVVFTDPDGDPAIWYERPPIGFCRPDESEEG